MTGVKKDCSTLQPDRSRALRVECPRPNSSAHSLIVCVRPRNVILRLERLFNACCLAVAQRQFPGSYPFALLIRSMLVPSGGSPMSAAKASKEFLHGRHILMPALPYFCQVAHDWFSHLSIILHQIRYSLVCDLPWVVFARMVASLRKQPHDLLPPARRRAFGMVPVLPHSQRHSKNGPLCLMDPAKDTTVHFPNCFPSIDNTSSHRVPNRQGKTP